MNAAVLAEPGRRKLAELAERAVVLVPLAALHALIIYLLSSGQLGNNSGFDAPVIEAEVIPSRQRIADPPSLPPVMLQESVHIDIPSLQVAFNVPAEEGPATGAIDIRDLMVAVQLPVIARAPPQVETIPVVGPRPLAGPRGVDRYPSASLKAKESGTVTMNICVSPAGKVDSVELAQSSGFPRLDNVALGIASEYRFQPATLHGHPIAACAHYRITFKVT